MQLSSLYSETSEYLVDPALDKLKQEARLAPPFTFDAENIVVFRGIYYYDNTAY